MNSENSKRDITFDELASALAKDYESIYVINSGDDSYVEYVTDVEHKNLTVRDQGENFYKAVIKNCRELVYPDDQERFLESFRKETVTEVLKNGKAFSLDYRLVINGEPQHYFLKTIQGADDMVIIGVRNVDEQRRRELSNEEKMLTYSRIAGALASRYEVIYYININSNKYTTYSSSEVYAKLGTTKQGADFFADTVEDVKKYIFKDDIEYVLNGLDKKTLLTNMRETGTVTLTYRQQLGDGIKYVSLIAVIPKNDPAHIVIGVLNVDAQMKREQSIIEENERFNHVAMALASRYEVIYRVNIETNEYYEFSSSEKYTKLEVGNRGDDFFADSQRNMTRDIYEEDYPMMKEAINKEHILKKLEHMNKIYLHYRLNLDGRPQYVSLVILRLKKDEKHIIVALENVDETKRRELEFEEKIGSAMDMANKDALTSVKNKHAYVSIEATLNEQIAAKTEGLEFAIAICDINGLKQVNDEQGHSAGDQFIKDACAIICEVFDHSPVYRIGGDEFVILLRGHDYEHRQDLIKHFYNIQVENKRNGLVTLAYGMSEYYPERDLTVQDVFERADNLMYANKKRFKEQPVNEEAQAIESYSFVRFYELYEQLLSAMVNFDKLDVDLIQELLGKIGKMFRLSKGITRVYRNAREEAMGLGDTYIPFDNQVEGYEVLTIKAVTSVMSSATCTVYMSKNEEPLSPEELSKVELVMRTVVSFVSRNRLKDVVYELAYFDESGYPNLRSLNRELGRIVQTRSFGNMMAVRYNLRHFSIINQEFGRETGDEIIKRHYDNLKKILGETGFVARLGGDNFVAIGPKDKAKEVADYLFETVIKVDETSSVKVPTSAGIFVPPEGFLPENPGDIMGKIINAYRVAQTGGRSHIIFYSDELMFIKQKYAKVQQMLSDALANEEFRPYYQPKVDVNTGRIVGGEALCRWFRDGQVIQPVDFIPALEQTSDICKLDLYMLEQVCKNQRAWLDGGEGRKLVPMSINFSRKHIMNTEIPDVIESILDKYRIPHEAIEIEFTETTTDVEFSDLKRIVASLHEKGIYASVDDFGVGFSSLNLLRDIPWKTIKIDKSFVPEDGDAPDSEKCIMFKNVVLMAKSLGFECLAEGVETEFQIKIMRKYGCDIVQGYYYDKPLPKEEFEARLVTKQYEK